jgi:hypothetical protein
MGRYRVRGTVLLAVFTVFVLPLFAAAQGPARVPRIAFLGFNVPPSASEPSRWFCRKFSFEAICGMISLDEQR